MNCIKPPYNVIVYAGGKTGGSTLFQTFLKTEYSAIHIHSDKCFRESCFLGMPPFEKTDDPQSIFELIDKDKEVYIIDVYRNPLDRKISAYFQNLDHNRKYYKVPENIGIEEEVDYFTTHVMPYLENYEGIEESMNYFGLTNLEYKKNHWYSKKGNVNFIRLKFREINKWVNILKLYIPNVPSDLVNTNLSINKSYYARYKLFKKLFMERYLI